MNVEKMKAAMEAICAEQGWELANFYAINGDKLDCSGQAFVVVNAALAEYQTASQKYTFASGVGLPGRVWAGDKTEWCPNVQNLDPTKYARLQLAKDMGIKACLGVPYKQDGKFYGVMEFFSTEEKASDEGAAAAALREFD